MKAPAFLLLALLAPTLHATPLLVVSDIDDTIKDTRITDGHARAPLPGRFLEFLHPQRWVPGMPELYRHWESRVQARFAYVSGGPTFYAGRLEHFRKRAGFPRGEFFLRRNLFTPIRAHKITAIDHLLRDAPSGTRLVLVGDSGEIDPEIYHAILLAHRPAVAAVFIRRRSDDAACRMRQLFAGLPAARFRLFTTPADLKALHSSRSPST